MSCSGLGAIRSNLCPNLSNGWTEDFVWELLGMGVNMLHDFWLFLGLQGTKGVHESSCPLLNLRAFLYSEGPESRGLVLRHIGPKTHRTTAWPPLVSPSLSTEGPVGFRNKGRAHRTIQFTPGFVHFWGGLAPGD